MATSIGDPLLDAETLGCLIDGALDEADRVWALGVVTTSAVDLELLADTVHALGPARSRSSGGLPPRISPPRDHTGDTVPDHRYRYRRSERDAERAPTCRSRSGARVDRGDARIRADHGR